MADTRDVTITLDDGTTHTYKGVPKTVTPDQVEERASKEFSGKKVTNISGGAAPQEPEGSVSISGMLNKAAEIGFGKGTPEETGTLSRVGKILSTGAGAGTLAIGAKAAAPALITGGEMVSRAPGIVPKAIGGAMIAGGELAKGITPQQVIGAAGAGAGQESFEQTASALGADRATQVALGFLGAPIGQFATEYPGKMANLLMSAVQSPLKYIGKAMLGDAFKDIASDTATKLRSEAVDKAKDELLSGNVKQAGATIKDALTGGVEAQQRAKQAEALLQAAAEKDKIEKLRGVQTTQAGVAQKAQEDIARQQVNFGASVPTENLASNLQSEVVATQKPIVEARAKEYKETYGQAIKSAESKEAEGNYWQNTDGGQSVKNYWQSRIDAGKYSSESQKAIESVLNDIYGSEGNPKSITAIDEKIRMLGDKASRESSGYGAIGDKLAGDLRRSITEGEVGSGEEAQKIAKGVYDWEPKLREAKSSYKLYSDQLKSWETKSAQKTLGDETKSLSLLNQYFTSRQGFNNLVTELGGDKNKAAQYGTQYAVNQLKDKTPAQIEKWLSQPKNGWVREIPGLEQKITQHAQSIESLTSKAERATKTVERLGKEIPKLEESQKTWPKSVDDWATKHYKDVIGSARPEDAFKNILTSEKAPTPAQLKALSTYIGQNPQAKAAVGTAVKSILAEQSPKTMTDIFKNRIAPTLEQTGLMSKKDINEIGLQARKIYEADVKDYSIKKDKKAVRAMDFLTGAISAKISGQLTPTPKAEEE